ncbi:unnamed protein product, partial [Ectocarpus fasciculatus]
VSKFLPIAPALVRALRAADAATQTQGLCDALYCTQAIAGVPGGMDRLLRAGAAPAVVSRLSAASGERAARANEEKAPGGGRSGAGGAGVEEKSKTGGPPPPPPPGEDGQAAAGGTPSPGSRSSSPAGLGGGGGGGDPKADRNGGPADGDTQAAAAAAAERSEALALAFVGRALEASGGGCLGSRELTAVAEAFRDDPTPAKFGFLDLLLRWASLREEGEEAAPFPGGEGGVGAWTRDGPFPAALREGLLQALHGAAEDDRRDSALALLASLLRAVGPEWAVEDDGEEADDGGSGGRKAGAEEQRRSSNGAKKKGKAKRKRGTFVAFAVRCAAGEVRILLDEALSLFVPAEARGGARASNGDEEAGPGGGRAEEEEGGEGGGGSSKNRWEELPIDTLQDLQK